MDENKTELNEELENNVVEETAAEEVNEPADTEADKATADAETAEDSIESVSDSAIENSDAFDDSAETLPENIESEIEQLDNEGKKKSFPLQKPVIIAACILLVALLGYFLYVGFFLKTPEGVTWSQELDGATYYFEFKDGGALKAYVGSIEIDSTYQKEKTDSGNTLTVGTNICNFYAGNPATYTISGSRILGNQVLNYSYGEGNDFALNQSSRKEATLDLPKDFTANEDLLGTWVFQYFGYDIYKVTFNDNGSIKLQFLQDGITYNGTYTVEGDNINFTYYVADSVATQLPYTVDGDKLNFLGASFIREGSDATPDQQALQVPQGQ
jgi:hypothetical protein